MADHESISETEDVQRPTPGVDLEANRVSSGYLSCEIPVGWVATADEPTSSHPFTICPEGASAEDGVEIICVRLPPFPDEFHKVGTPDLRLTLMKSTLFTLDRTPFLPRPLDYHTVEAHGCTCAITQVVVRDNPGFEFYIHQDGPQRELLRVTFYSWENECLKEAQALVEELARSVRVYENETPECVRAFRECLDTKVEPERFEQLANQYVSPLNATRMTAYKMAAYIVEAYNTDNLSSRKRMKLGLEEFASFNKSLEPYFEQLADAADAQSHYYEEGSEQLASIRAAVTGIFNQLPITPDNLGDARLPMEDARKLMIIASTYMSNPTKTVQTAIDKTLAPSERMRVLFSRVGIAPSEGKENKEPNPEPAKSRDVDVPTLVMSLLSDGYVSFEDSDIPRKKGHHAIAGVGVSEQKREGLALIARQNGFDDANELIDYFVSALQEVEKDEVFFVPKKTGINKGLYRIVRKGDLTGITFANMANYTDSFRIKSEGPDAYQVEYSEPVAIGLPRFFGMVCRLIWDLRQCENAQRGIPFSVRFSRIGIEFNRIGRMSVWWEYPKVTFVDGAQDDPALVNVSSAPSTDLTEGIEIVGEQPAGADAEADSMDLPATMLALLSNGYVSFGEKDLSWSKGHHVIYGLQIGSPVHPRLAALARVNGFKNTDDLLEHFMAFMKQVDKDEELIVPKASIAKALGPVVRRGDLTGITLVNLTASEAFRVINDSPNSYTVMYDDALADGIPHFFDLMCRLLWDLRQCVETLKDAPFQVTFTSCRNLDLSQLLRGSVSRVDGAQDNPGTVSVSEAPAIGLEVATAEEVPVDEEGPSVELQKPDLTQLLRGNVSRANGAQDNPSTVNVTKTPAVDLGEHTAQGAASTPAAKKAPTISEKRAGLEKVLDRLLTAATKYREASGALWQYEEDERTLEEMPAKKKRLEKKILSIQRKQQAISDELTANASRKHDLQEERKQLLSRADMLEEKAHELEEERGGRGFFSILRKSQINSALKTIASRQDEIRACTGQIDEELKSLAKTRKKLLKDIKEPEGKIAREQAKLEELLQEEKETKDRLENAEKSRGTLSTERSTAKGQRTKALKRYNDLISGQLFTSAEKKSDEYREMKELMASALTKLKEQGVTPTNRATFPTLEA